jgi:signal transduction histidine kinase
VKRILPILPLLVPALTLCGQGTTAPTPEKAQALVKAAIAFGRKNGVEALIRETNQTTGRFHAGSGAELYIFIYDQQGVCRAIGFDTARWVGKNRLDAKDADGKYFLRELLKVAREKGEGWVDYRYENPVTKALEAKTSYVEMVEGLVVGAGIYKH